MSVVVGLIDKDELYMAGDSACAHPDLGWICTDQTPKVWRQDQYLIGVVGKCRVADVVSDSLDLEDCGTAHDFVEKVRVALRKGGALKVQNGLESMDGEILIGVGGKLFQIVSNFGVFQPKLPYHAIGAGTQYALGALYAMRKEDWVPATKVSIAIEAAAEFSPYVTLPIVGRVV